ncbi:MAG: translation initiation factor eIF-1A [Candidatus Micrarchaeia archaeon]
MRKDKQQSEEVHELKLPQSGEVVGIVSQVLGASNFRVRCSDGFERLCSIPGRLKREFWIKDGDIVLVKPWVVQSNERGDIIWRYSLGDKDRLKASGYNLPD